MKINNNRRTFLKTCLFSGVGFLLASQHLFSFSLLKELSNYTGLSLNKIDHNAIEINGWIMLNTDFHKTSK